MSDDRATRLPDSRVQPRFAGVCSFGRWPVLGEDGPCDWAVLGVPFDGGVTYRPGCRFGPRAIREQSQYLKHYSIEHSIDVPGSLRLADAGDAPVRPFDVEQTLTSVRVHAASLADRAERLLMLGGDHSIAFAGMMHAWERSGRPAGGLACIHFDSHLDTIDTVWGEQWNHATPFRRLIEAGALDPKRMISLGIKGPLNSADDLEYARDHGIEILGHDASLARGPDRLREFVSRLAGGLVYLSFDIDCIDPAYAPGTGTPCVGGFTSAEALMLIRACAGANIVGADVVEVLPDRDVAGNTALLAAHVAFEILACDAVRRRDKRDSGPA